MSPSIVFASRRPREGVRVLARGDRGGEGGGMRPARRRRRVGVLSHAASAPCSPWPRVVAPVVEGVDLREMQFGDVHSNNIVLLAAAFGAVVEEEAEEEEAEVEKNGDKEEVDLADDTGLFAAPIRWWNGIPARARG